MFASPLVVPSNALLASMQPPQGSMSMVGGFETANRLNTSDFAGVSGQLWVSYFTSLVPVTITKLAISSGNGAAASVTLARMALFSVAADDSVTLIARTDSDNTIGAATFTAYERALSTVGGFPSSVTIPAGVRYATGFLMVATTPCHLKGDFITDSAVPPILSRIITGQTDIQNSYAVALLPTTFTVPYVRGRP